jgi:peptide/nickel transport system substrate-binding protein
MVVGHDQTVVVAVHGVINSFNPNTVQGSTPLARMVMQQVWPQVFRMTSGLGPSLNTNVVTSAELVRLDPQTVVYQINPSATWSDGVPISAADFIYNWQASAGIGTDVGGVPFSDASTFGYREIQSVTGSNGGKTVTVVFKTPFADWMSLFNDLAPAHIALRAGWNTGFNSFNPRDVISGGPYMISSFSPGAQIVLTRNPRWWGAKPRVAKIVFRIVAGLSGELQAILQRKASMAYMAPITSAQMGDLAALSSLPWATFDLGLSSSFLQLDFNEASPLLAITAVRQAIAKATDREAILNATLGQVMSHIGLVGDHLLLPSQAGYTSAGAGYDRPHIATARKLLESAGFVQGPSGYFQLAGQTLTLRIAADRNSPLDMQVEKLFEEQMRRLGVLVTAENASAATLYGKILPSGNYDIALVRVTASPFPSVSVDQYSEVMSRTLGSGAPRTLLPAGAAPGVDGATTPGSIGPTAAMVAPGGPGGLRDFTRFEDLRVDALYAQAIGELDPSRSFVSYAHLDALLWADMVSLPLFQLPSLIVKDSRILGIQGAASMKGLTWHAQRWEVLVPAPKQGSAQAGS